jgi:hypothetical protein
MSCKMTDHEFETLKEALECNAHDLFRGVQDAMQLSLVSFQALGDHPTQEARDEALRVSRVHTTLVDLFHVRFPAAARELFPDCR